MTKSYRNPSLPPQERAADLISRMTLDEKIAQLHALWLTLSPGGAHEWRKDQFSDGRDAESLRRMLSLGLGQITRPLGGKPMDARDGVRALNSLQKFMMEETRLGIPVMSHEECLTGLLAEGATLFPSALAYGATWNPDLIEDVGRAIGQEARAVGCRQVLAPVLDVSRDVRWGRTEESFGEDPYLVGLLGTRYVQGIQGETRDLLATLKHFAGHSFSEGGRNHAPVNVGWRELNDTFLLPFEMAVKLGNAGSVMPAYHAIDAVPCHANRQLLTAVLREDWGFDGLIVADYTGVSLLLNAHHVVADNAAAGALSISSGLDIELPYGECAVDLKSAIAKGQIGLDVIDAAVTRVLVEKFRVGLFETPYADETAIVLQAPATVELAREVARQSVVILDNTGVLPLNPEHKIALIGPTADDPLALMSGYSFPVHLLINDQIGDAANVVTPRAAFEASFGADHVIYARGCNILDERSYGSPVFPGDATTDPSAGLDIASRLSTRLDMIADAVAAARAADVAVVCVGDLSGLFQTGTVGEGSDTDSLDLPGVQQHLLDAIVATGKPVVVVVTSGRPYNLGGLESKLGAQVMAFFGGQQGGQGLVDVLAGAVEPSGRLSLSVPRNVGAIPYVYNHKFGSSGNPVARHFGSRYPFGHGLSFTEFVFEDLELAATKVDCETGTVSVSFTIRNSGNRDGVAVPQLYVHDQMASMARPVKELKAFAKVSIGAGTSARVRFEVPTDMFSFTGLEGKRLVEPGWFDLMVGVSSADIRLRTTVELVGKVHPLPASWRMTSRCEVTPTAA